MAPSLAVLPPDGRAEKLYSSRQIYMAAFLGGPLAAAWFMSRNYRALADEPRSRHLLWLGLAVTITVIAVALVLPQQVPRYLWPITYSVVIYQYARTLFDGPYQRHLAHAGAKGSWWAVLGVSLVGIVIVVALAMPLNLAFAALSKP
jgi:hypothetical protein